MQKKDYELIAAALRRARPVPEKKEQRLAWARVHGAITEALLRDNPKFNELKFFAASGCNEDL